MIGYTMVGTHDIKRAGAFFDEVLGAIGAKRSMEQDTFIVWSVTPDQPSFSVCLPHNGQEASIGNGVMTAFNAMSPEQVNEVHKIALENGGTDEGKPGERTEGFYAGYFRDPDGNKFAFFNYYGELGV